MHKYLIAPNNDLSKMHKKELYKAAKELDKELNKQMDIIYHSAAIALYRYHGWKAEQLHDLFSVVSQAVWKECAEMPNTSMIEMLWNEVGIEVMCEDKSQRWFEIAYLNSDLANYDNMTYFQFLAVRQNQKKWIAPQLTACILMSLLRKEGWTEKALGKLFQQIEDIKHENKLDPKALTKLCFDETDFCITDNVEMLGANKC